MYDELVKRLREDAPTALANCDFDFVEGWIKEAADAIEELSKPQNTVHLCTSCKYQYPECPADTGVVFGRGKGNDNICQCADYVARIPRWIPVTERLPESGVPTLICGDGNVVEQGFFDDEYGYWYDWGGNRTFVHHWMPLPQPPKEE